MNIPSKVRILGSSEELENVLNKVECLSVSETKSKNVAQMKSQLRIAPLVLKIRGLDLDKPHCGPKGMFNEYGCFICEVERIWPSLMTVFRWYWPQTQKLGLIYKN